MKEIVQRIRFQGKEYIFLGEDLDKDASITTVEAYQNGTAGYAHYYASLSVGLVKRFGKVIGYRKDIEFLGPIDVEIKDPISSMMNLLFDPSWDKREES